MDNFDKGGTPIRMPFIYSVEMICDWLAAGKAYRGKEFTFDDEYKWWVKKKEEVQKSMHPMTIEYCELVFRWLKDTGNISKKELKDYYNLSERIILGINGKLND